jgi:alkylated DNA nucleotide flippase Atl1
MDFRKALQFIAAVPERRWTAYKDVAAAAGNELGAMAVGYWLRQSGGSIPNYWRVLTVDGAVPDTFLGGRDGPRDAATAREVLRREGIWIDADVGRYSASASRSRTGSRFSGSPGATTPPSQSQLPPRRSVDRPSARSRHRTGGSASVQQHECETSAQALPPPGRSWCPLTPTRAKACFPPRLPSRGPSWATSPVKL